MLKTELSSLPWLWVIRPVGVGGEAQHRFSAQAANVKNFVVSSVNDLWRQLCNLFKRGFGTDHLFSPASDNTFLFVWGDKHHFHHTDTRRSSRAIPLWICQRGKKEKLLSNGNWNLQYFSLFELLISSLYAHLETPYPWINNTASETTVYVMYFADSPKMQRRVFPSVGSLFLTKGVNE